MSRGAARLFDGLLRRRCAVGLSLALLVLAGILGTTALPVDMSFRPTFTSDPRELERTREHEDVFGQVGFRDLVAMIEVRDARDVQALARVADLAERVRRLPHVVETRDPLHLPFFDEQGTLHANGVLGSLPAGVDLDSALGHARLATLLRSPAARRLVVGDENRSVALIATLDLPNEDFARRRSAVGAFREAVRAWSSETGYAAEITGYPEVEQVYAEEVTWSVFRGIACLLLTLLLILYAYFRRFCDVVTCLAGVTLAVPLVFGSMALLGQPFSIVNSQVLTLVLIVGIGQALHHQEEYRRRRETGRPHAAANREAFALLAWPSFMTGIATISGFAALLSADMRAIWSFGLSTALGVAIVYAVNWLVVPALIDRFYRNAQPELFTRQTASWTLSIVRRSDALLQRWPGWVSIGFLLATALLALLGSAGLRVDQRVNEELRSSHPAVRAERQYEQQFAGFLGPELAIRPLPSGPRPSVSELSAFVNRLCEMPEVRYVASPLDFSAQAALAPSQQAKACARTPGDLALALAARSGQAGPALQRLATPLISPDGSRWSVVVRLADIGTAQALPFVERVRAAARETLPHATVEPVGQWWLAQRGMDRLSYDMLWSAISALLVILPLMWIAIRDLELFLAAILPTILPVFATLGFMGWLHISVRIGTAMMLAIALGLAADDTIHLSVRIRDRVRSGSDPSSAVNATLLRTGRPCSFSSYVLIGGFASLLSSSLLALQAMGLIAVFSMSFALATDLLLGPALYLLLTRLRRAQPSPARSVRELLERTALRHPERPAVSYSLKCETPAITEAARKLRTLTWHEFTWLVLNVADDLERTLGTSGTVAVLADTDARYPVLELALALCGRTLQPLYVTASDEELSAALAATGAVLVAGATQIERARALQPSRALLELNALVSLPGIGAAPHAVLPAGVEPFDSTKARARLAAWSERESSRPRLYLQSTGTTASARWIVIDEAALLHASHSAANEAAQYFPRFLAFLPTAHISERLLTLYVALHLAGHTFYGGGVATLPGDLRASEPSALLMPPALLDALRRDATRRARANVVSRCLLRSVQRTADALLASGVTGGVARGLRVRLFGLWLLRRAGLHRVRDFLAGAAPVPPALHAWCEAAGLPLRIVYGQTELIGATSISARCGAHFGAVGLCAPGVELRISAEQELLVRSRARFQHYLGDPRATAAALAGDWLRTGDRAWLRSSGELVLLGRTQDLLRAPSGRIVDSACLASALREQFGSGEYVVVARDDGAYLYVAWPDPECSAAQKLVPLETGDPRWQAVDRRLAELEPESLVRGFALFEGAFQPASGELGPTGKCRGYRIHALRFEHLRLRAEAPLA